MLRYLIVLALLTFPSMAWAQGSSTIRPVSEKSSFQIALEGKRPVLVLFQGKTCAACRAVEHWLDQMSGDLAAQVDLVSVDIDDNPFTKKEFGVEGTPTMLMFRDGQQVGGLVGAVGYAELRTWIGKSAGIQLR